jgi:hypothetical protein
MAATLDKRIEQAMRHVLRGRQIVERQRNRARSASPPPGAVELLAQFERSQAIFEDDLARYLEERDRQIAAPAQSPDSGRPPSTADLK